jgi:hypothetical protein
MSKRRTYLKVFLFVGVAASVFFSTAQPAAAAFNPNNLMSDAVFDSVGSMDAGQIDAFLNQFPNSCISTNHGFRAIDPNGYHPNSSYSFGDFVSAGNVIAHAAQAYDINPQVLITTLQKEQSLVSGGGGCSTLAYAAAVGYGCPDSGTTHDYSNVNLYAIGGTIYSSVNGTCVNSASKVGFSQQVIRAAWLLKFGQQRSRGNVGWAVIRGNWDNSDDPQSCYGGPMTQGNYAVCPSGSTTYYDGYRTIDGSAVHMDTGATASLYWYTPHFHGNQNFVDTFTGWFGSPFQTYTWSTISQNAYTDDTKRTSMNLGQLGPGQRYYLTMVVKNTGNVTWQRGSVNLGAASPIDRSSPVCDSTWTSCNRAAPLHENSVAPGQYGSFEFWITTPQTPQFINEVYAPVMEGVTWLNSSTASFPMVVHSAAYASSVVGEYAYTNASKQTSADLRHLQPGQRYYLSYTFKNTGNMVLQKSGSNPTNLGTANPLDHASPFCDSTWVNASPSCNRVTALHENSVAPGQIGSFEFWITAPATGSYVEYYLPIVEGITWTNNPPVDFTMNVDPYSWAMTTQHIYTDSSKQQTANVSHLSPGQRYYFTIEMRNNGTVAWTRQGTHPMSLGTAETRDSASPLCDDTWTSCSRAAQLHENTVNPGQTGSFEFWIKAASSTGNYAASFTPLIDGSTWLGANYASIWSHVEPPSYTYQILEQNAFTDSSKQTRQNLGNLTHGQRAYLTVIMKNTGNVTWYKNGGIPLQLATASPVDRNSSFCDSGTWMACNRVASLHENAVGPGQYGSFEFWITAPGSPGSYNEAFAPVAANYTWMNDHTIGFPMVVH